MDTSSFTIVSLLTGVLHFVVDIVFLVVTITVVQKRRPDAGTTLLLANIGSLCLLIATPIAYAVIGRSTSSDMTMFATMQLGTSVVSVAIQALVILSVTKLARPPSPPAYGPVDPRRF